MFYSTFMIISSFILYRTLEICDLRCRVNWTWEKMKGKKEKYGFPGSPVVENLPCNAGDTGFISGQKTKIPHTWGAIKPVCHN